VTGLFFLLDLMDCFPFGLGRILDLSVSKYVCCGYDNMYMSAVYMTVWMHNMFLTGIHLSLETFLYMIFYIILI